MPITIPQAECLAEADLAVEVRPGRTDIPVVRRCVRLSEEGETRDSVLRS